MSGKGITIGNFFEQSWLLIISSFCFGLLIAVTNAAWAPRIQQNKIDKLNRLMTGLIPEAEAFEPALEAVEIKLDKGKKRLSNIYKAVSENGQCAGWVFNCEGSGFADKIELVVAVDRDFERLAGFDCLTSNETPGFGDQIKLDYYRNQFKGAFAKALKLIKVGDDEKIDSKIVAISGATVSSQAVVTIINSFIGQIKNQLQAKGLINNGK